MKRTHAACSRCSSRSCSLVSQSLYTVDQRQSAIKFQLGEIVAIAERAGPVLQGAAAAERALSSTRASRRSTTPKPERFTHVEKKNVLVDFFVKWRIIDVAQYYVSVRGDEEARTRRASRRRCAANLRAEFGKRTVHEVVSGRARQDHGDRRATRPTRTRERIGVEVVDVRLKRVDLPPGRHRTRLPRAWSRSASASPTSCARSGAAEAEKIRADADRQRQVIVAEAYSDAQAIKGEGDAKASAIYATAYPARTPSSTGSTAAWRPTGRPSASKSDVLVLDPQLGVLQVLAELERRPGPANSAVARALVDRAPMPDGAAGGARAHADPRRHPAVRRAAPLARDVRKLIALSDGQLRFIGLARSRGCRPSPGAGDADRRLPSRGPSAALAVRAGSFPSTSRTCCPPRPSALERLRRRSSISSRAHGYRLVQPPLLEYLESLLTGTGRDLDLQTFKVVDQLSGRMLGVRADITPQVARIDAHLLNAPGVTRLCYAAACCTRCPRA